uniref:Uncharacterized protein n=1 Tax=Physcomitrium patens TaxID=3218 RepID=A0A2K1JMJ4_PHYPA|nr:hypothetical protein PHYPA_017605 [Physcomitrium patens]
MFKNIKGRGFLSSKSFCREVESPSVTATIGTTIHNSNCDGAAPASLAHAPDSELLAAVFPTVPEVSAAAVAGCCKVLVGRELSLIEAEARRGYRGSAPQINRWNFAQIQDTGFGSHSRSESVIFHNNHIDCSICRRRRERLWPAYRNAELRSGAVGTRANIRTPRASCVVSEPSPESPRVSSMNLDVDVPKSDFQVLQCEARHSMLHENLSPRMHSTTVQLHSEAKSAQRKKERGRGCIIPEREALLDALDLL